MSALPKEIDEGVSIDEDLIELLNALDDIDNLVKEMAEVVE